MTAAERRRQDADNQARIARMHAHTPRCPLHGCELTQGYDVEGRGTGEVWTPNGQWSCFRCQTEAAVQTFRAGSSC